MYHIFKQTIDGEWEYICTMMYRCSAHWYIGDLVEHDDYVVFAW